MSELSAFSCSKTQYENKQKQSSVDADYLFSSNTLKLPSAHYKISLPNSCLPAYLCNLLHGAMMPRQIL